MPSVRPVRDVASSLAAAGLLAACGTGPQPADDHAVVAVSLTAASDLVAAAGVVRAEVTLRARGEEPVVVDLDLDGAPAFLHVTPAERADLAVALLDATARRVATAEVALAAAAGDLTEVRATTLGDARHGVRDLDVAEPRTLRAGRDYEPGRYRVATRPLSGTALHELVRDLGARLVDADVTHDTYLLEIADGESVAGAIEEALTFAVVRGAWPDYREAGGVDVAVAGPTFGAGTRARPAPSSAGADARAPWRRLGAARDDVFTAAARHVTPRATGVLASAARVLSAAWSATAGRYNEPVTLAAHVAAAPAGTPVTFRILDAETGEVVARLNGVADAAGRAGATWSYDYLRAGGGRVANRFFFVAEVPGGARGSDTLSLTEPFQVTFRRSDGAVLPGRDYRLEFPDGTRLTATSDLMGALRREDYVPGEVEVVDPYTGYVLDRFDPVRDLRPDDPGFVDGLMAAAAPGQPLWRRIHALNDLGNLRAQAAIPMLTALLDEPEQAIWYNAALSLGNMGTPQDAVVSAILAKLAIAVNEEELERAVDVLGALGDARAAPALRPLAMGVAGPVRAHALYALGRLPVSDEALATLIANLEGGAVFDPPWIRAEAALAVGRLGDRRAIPALIGVLNESWTVVRLRAAEALGRLVGEGDVDAVGPLRSLLVDTDHRVVLQAAVALERIEGEAARGALATAVQNPRVPKWAKAQVRRVAAGY